MQALCDFLGKTKTENQQNERNDKFDELAKGMAQSVTRRGALRKFGVGLSGIALASLGLAHEAEAGNCRPNGTRCMRNKQCCSGYCYKGDEGGPIGKSDWRCS